MSNITKQTILCGLLVIALGGCAQIKDEFGFGGKTAPKPTALKPIKTQLAVHRAWQIVADNGSQGRAVKLGSAVNNDMVVTAAANGDVVAVDNAGKVKWRHKVADGVSSGPALDDGLVAVGSGAGKLVALNAKTGKQIWQADLDGEILAAPAIDANAVYAKTLDNTITAFSPADGSTLWRYQHLGVNQEIQLRGSSAPVVADNKIIAGFADGVVDAVDTSKGQLVWQRRIASPQGIGLNQSLVDIDANPVVHNGMVYVASYQGNLAALTLADGRILWSHPISTLSGLAVDDSNIYVADTKGQVWAFDQNSGGVMWRTQQLKYRSVSAPAVMGNAVVVGDKQGFLHWLSTADGHFVARERIVGAPIVAAPVVRGDDLYAITNSGSLAEFTTAKLKASKVA